MSDAKPFVKMVMMLPGGVLVDVTVENAVKIARSQAGSSAPKAVILDTVKLNSTGLLFVSNVPTAETEHRKMRMRLKVHFIVICTSQ